MLCESYYSEQSYSPHASLNPCSNGRCSARVYFQSYNSVVAVLILVLMEDALRDLLSIPLELLVSVLILVLMEDALRAFLSQLITSGT